MPFFVKANLDDHTLSVTSETAKEAFAKAIEWNAVERFTDIKISDGTKSLTIAEFSWVMALLEIGKTVEVDRAAGSKAKSKS